ncbi:MAG: flagellar export protein FliJ [Bacteriovoracia bacterium]
MKRYHFKLQSLLRIREFAEHNVKLELGKINQEIAEVEAQIKQDHLDLDEAYKSQQAMLSNGTPGHMVQFYPLFTQGKKAHIDQLENKLWSLKKKYQNKLEELKEKRAAVKLMESLKEKDRIKYRKEQLKLEEKKREDLIQSWSSYNKEE